MIFSFVLISDVSGLENNFEIVDISLKDKSGSISVSNPSINDNSVVSNIVFYEINDFVTFELVLKNNNSDKYKIDSIVNNNISDNVMVEYDFDHDYIEPGHTFNISVKLSYHNQLLNKDKLTLNDLSIKLNLLNSNGSSSSVVLDPKTGDNLIFYFSMFSFLLLVYF